MRSDLESNKGHDLDIFSLRVGVVRQVLAGDFEIPSDGPIAYYLDPDGSDRNVTLPVVRRGEMHAIVNVGVAGRLLVKTQEGTLLNTLTTVDSAIFVSSSREWRYFADTLGQPYEPTDITSSDNSITPTVTGASTLDLVVNPAHVDHNLLLNYEANRHIDHTAVSISAGEGLTGGGDISASRSLALALHGLSTVTPELADEFLIYDVGGGAHKKITGTTLNGILDHNALLNYSANRHIDHTAVSITAGEGLTGGGTIETTRTLSLNIHGLTADTPISASEFAFYDTVAGEHNKVTLSNLATAMYATSSGAALTKVDDTNVTLLLGGTPSTALLKGVSLTLGWAGYLGLDRGGLGGSQSAATAGQIPIYPGSGGAAVPTSYVQSGTGPVARTWTDKVSDHVSIVDFGASPGASAATNTTAIQNALATKKPVYVPPGEYLHNAFTITNEGQILFGAGRSMFFLEGVTCSSLKLASGQNTDGITVGGDDDTGVNVVIKDLTINHNGANQSGGSALKIKGGAAYTQITRVKIFEGYLHNIHVVAPDYAHNGAQVLITDCQIQDYPFTTWHRTGNGIYFDGSCQACIVSNCDISGGTLNSTTTAAIKCVGTADIHIQNCNIWSEDRKIWAVSSSWIKVVNTFIHSDVETTAVDGVVLDGCSKCVVTSNLFDGIIGKAVQLKTGTINSVVGNNTFTPHGTYTSTHAVSEEDTSDYNVISNNSLRGTFSNSPSIVIVGANTESVGNTGDNYEFIRKGLSVGVGMGGYTSGGIIAAHAIQSGVPGAAAGNFVIAGATSGTVTLGARSVAGTPTVTFGTGTGTPAVTATAPLSISSTTGDISIPSGGTFPAFTLGGTISGGGNQINDVIIGTTTPLAGFFTTLTVNGAGAASKPLIAGRAAVITNEQAYSFTFSSANGIAGAIIDTTQNNGGAFMYFMVNNNSTQIGSITEASSTSVAFNTTSDIRLKHKFNQSGIDWGKVIDKLPVLDYERIDEPDRIELGVIAQQVYEVFPQVVTKPKNDEDMWQVDYGRLAALALWGVRDLRRQLAEQRHG